MRTGKQSGRGLMGKPVTAGREQGETKGHLVTVAVGAAFEWSPRCVRAYTGRSAPRTGSA